MRAEDDDGTLTSVPLRLGLLKAVEVNIKHFYLI